MKILAVDIDGVLTKETEGWDYATRSANEENIRRVNQLFHGNHILLFTARFPLDRSVTEKWLKDWGVKYHDIIFGKPQYDCIIDDRATSLEVLCSE